MNLLSTKSQALCVFLHSYYVAKAEAPKLWPLDVKSWLLIGRDAAAGKDWRQEEKGAEDEMVR